MNKKEALLRVSEQIRALAEDETTVSWDQWHEDGWINFRFRPHHEPPSDPYAELKAAHAAGKVIQCKQIPSRTWLDINNPGWTAPAESYRIKPGPQKLPLCADDIKAGDEFLAPDRYRRQWQKISDNGIMFVWGCASWEELNSRGWKIRSIGEPEWRPCYKLVEQ